MHFARNFQAETTSDFSNPSFKLLSTVEVVLNPTFEMVICSIQTGKNYALITEGAVSVNIPKIEGAATLPVVSYL